MEQGMALEEGAGGKNLEEGEWNNKGECCQAPGPAESGSEVRCQTSAALSPDLRIAGGRHTARESIITARAGST
jgi:hypothetical protein